MNGRWDGDTAALRAQQAGLAGDVVLRDGFPTPLRTIAGFDVGFEDDGATTRAAAVLLDADSLQVLASEVARIPTRMPYIPGLLSFRELPAVLAALEQLREPPDLLLCDGQGIAHPRRFGIASHLGLLVDIPAIGVAKTRLCGTHEEPPNQRGAWTPLWGQGEIIGAVLRTRPGVKPLYISPGHRVGLETAIAYVMGCCTRYRLPETTRHAHRLASGPR